MLSNKFLMEKRSFINQKLISNENLSFRNIAIEYVVKYKFMPVYALSIKQSQCRAGDRI